MTSNDNTDARPKKKFDLVSLKQENKLDIWLSINYLARANKGIQDFIVNHFYSFDDQVVEFFLPQLWYVIIFAISREILPSLEFYIDSKRYQLK